MAHKPIMIRADLHAYVRELKDLFGYQSLAEVVHVAIVEAFPPSQYDLGVTISSNFSRDKSGPKRDKYDKHFNTLKKLVEQTWEE